MKLTTAFALLATGVSAALAATRRFDFVVNNAKVSPDGFERE